MQHRDFNPVGSRLIRYFEQIFGAKQCVFLEFIVANLPDDLSGYCKLIFSRFFTDNSFDLFQRFINKLFIICRSGKKKLPQNNVCVIRIEFIKLLQNVLSLIEFIQDDIHFGNGFQSGNLFFHRKKVDFLEQRVDFRSCANFAFCQDFFQFDI